MRKKIGKIRNPSLARTYRRKLSIRKKIIGTAERPRLCAVRSNKHMSIQIINDSNSKTILSISTFGKNAVQNGSNTIEGAKNIGSELGRKLLEKGIHQVVFDRNGKGFNAVLKSLVDNVREVGVQI